MNTLDKVYDLTIDIKNIDVKYNSYAKFFDDDRETSVIKVKILNNNSPIDLENDFGSYANTSPALNVFPLVRSVSNCIDT